MTQNIVITGASSGLGAALALEYATSGTNLGLTGRNIARLEETADQCRRLGANVVTSLIDVTDSDKISEWLKQFDRDYPIDLCIANAGISGGTGDAEIENATQVKQIFDVNVTGVINTIHPVMENMIRRGKGQVAIVSSIASFIASPSAAAYCASKAAIRVYGHALQRSLVSHGVNVSVICPGFIKTPMTDVNPFAMPLIMSGDKAARIIRKGLEKRKILIIFPKLIYVIARLQNMLPEFLISRIYHAIPSKPNN